MSSSIHSLPAEIRPAGSNPPRYLTNILLGLILRRCRESRNLTQEKVAERAGCHASYLSAIENGKADLSIKTFDRLCKALAVSAYVLYLQAELLEEPYLDSDIVRTRGNEPTNPLVAQYWLDEFLKQRPLDACRE